jgi:hypothetical protein
MPGSGPLNSQVFPPAPHRGDKVPRMPWSMPVGKMSVDLHGRALTTVRVAHISTVIHNSGSRLPPCAAVSRLKLRRFVASWTPREVWQTA